MKTCSNCFFNQGEIDLCMDAEARLSGKTCEYFSGIEIEVDGIFAQDVCLLCGGPNDQLYKGKQYCTQCEERYCKTPPNEYSFEIGV